MSSLRTLWHAFPKACLAFPSSGFRKGKLFWLALEYHGAKPTLLLGVIPRLGLALGVLESSLASFLPWLPRLQKNVFFDFLALRQFAFRERNNLRNGS